MPQCKSQNQYWLHFRYEAILTEENKAKYKKFVEEYNQATGT